MSYIPSDAPAKRCHGCHKVKPLTAYKLPRMRECLECQAARIDRYKDMHGPAKQHPLQRHDGPSPYATYDGMLAMLRIRRRKAKLAKLAAEQAAAPRKYGPRFDYVNAKPAPPLPDLDRPRKCRTCSVVKPQRDYRVGTYTCNECHDRALAGTRPVGPPRGMRGGRRNNDG